MLKVHERDEKAAFLLPDDEAVDEVENEIPFGNCMLMCFEDA